MKNLRLSCTILAAFIFAGSAAAQSSKAVAPPQPMAKRTVTKTDRFDFGSGGTININGAPNGSITVVGWPKNEIEITARIEIEAANEADLAKVAELTGYATDESPIRVGISTIGSHNKFGMKKLPKDFPKTFIGLPFRVDYVVNVPKFSDLEIDGGKGDLSIKGVEGSMRVNFIEAKAAIEVFTGTALITIAGGSLDLALGARGWRGRFVNVGLGSGDLNVRLPYNISAELDASIIKTGSIDNKVPDLKPRDRKIAFTDRSIAARAGAGGAALKFTVGDGTMKLEKMAQPL